MVRWIHESADLTLVPSSASMADLEAAGVERLARWGRGVDLDTYHPRNRLDGDEAITAAEDAAEPMASKLPPVPVVNVIKSHCPWLMSGFMVNTANIMGMLSTMADKRPMAMFAVVGPNWP